MSAVKIFHRKSALSRMVNGSGGRTVLAALRDAEKETADLREEGRSILMEAIAAIEATGAAPVIDGGDWLDAAYRAAADLIDVCPPELPALHRAVYGLCDLADRQRRAGRFEKAPIAIHIAALRPLSRPDLDAAASSEVLAGLAALLARETGRQE